VVVTVNGVASVGQMFTYTPQISGMSPNPVLAESPVTIQGTNFGGQQNNSTVTFNGVAAVVSGWTNSSIAATLPGTATAGPVVVTVNGVASNGVTFSFPGLYSFSLGYAPNGDVLTAGDSVNGNWTYSYDDFNRLAASSNSSPQQGYSYSYDQYGNFWAQNVTAGTGRTAARTFTAATAAYSNGNCYHGVGQTNQPDGYCYDAAGNLLSDGQHSYTYDGEGRIIQVDGGQTASYSYDAEGNRIQKVSGAGTAAYLYDLGGHVIAEVNGAGMWTRGEVYAAGRHLATYSNGSQGTTYLVQADWLGTERERLLPNGDVFQTCASLPFGDGLSCNGAADPSPNHMTGKERDSETGLDYFGKRYLSSAMGRFTSTDPVVITPERLKNPQQLNQYAYVQNNPLRYVDPTGEELVATGNLQADQKDLCAIAGDACSRVSIDEKAGTVSFDTKGLDLSKNEGAALINDLVSSKNTYEFSEGPTVQTDKGPVKIDYIIANLPSFGDQPQIGKPRAGVSDVVALNFDNKNITRISNTKLGVAPNFTTAFHELAEAYEKIDGGKGGSYAAGHNAAMQREEKLRDQRPYLKDYNHGSGGPANSPNPEGGIIIKK
jgi:RHS repeat-associated protein